MSRSTFQSEFAVGDRVLAWWNSPQSDYYIGTVAQAGGIVRSPDGTLKSVTDYLVQFDDGDQKPVPPDLIFPLALPAGMQIEFRSPDDPRYQPAVVVEATNDIVKVRTPDQRDWQVNLAAIRVEGRFLKGTDQR